MHRIIPFLLTGCLITTTVHAQQENEIKTLLRILPDVINTDRPAEKCGTPAALTLLSRPDSIQPDDRMRIEQVVSRPALSESYVSDSGIFRIHYDLTGRHAIDSSATMITGIPDIAVVAAQAADHAYALLIDSLGFVPHVSDDGADGPEYDIYLLDLGAQFYGWTIPDDPTGASGGSYYSQVENDFAGSFATQGLDAVRVTVAHEYFHAVQFAYANKLDDIFFYEMSSVWFEEKAYPEINDYLAYLSDLFNQPDQSLFSQIYASNIWLKYRLAGTDGSPLRVMWEEFRDNSAATVIRLETERAGLPLAGALAEFYSWCLFTGERAVPGMYFDDARFFPQLRPLQTIDVMTDTLFQGKVRSMAANYIVLKTDATRSFAAQYVRGDAENMRLAGVSENLDGSLGDYFIQRESEQYFLPVQENEGVVNLILANANEENSDAFKRWLYDLDVRLLEDNPDRQGIQAVYPNPLLTSAGSVVSIPFSLPEQGRTSLSILDETGRVVLDVSLGERPGGRNRPFAWDGRDENGERVASGIYLVVLRMDNGFQDVAKIAVIGR